MDDEFIKPIVVFKGQNAAYEFIKAILKEYQYCKKVIPFPFHNLRGYDSHLIFNELNKFDVKIDVIPNRLKKYMAFF